MTVRWGLIGAGDIVRKRVAAALRDLPNCELISVSRSRHDFAGEFAEEFGIPKWFADWREQIVDEDIDAVYIATPVYLHAQQTMAAAEAGKHVLCEKPMALTVAECDTMIAACEKNNLKLGVAYYRRFYPAVIRAKEIITSGEIGQISVAQMNAFEYFDPPDEHSRGWLLDPAKSGGGPLIDFGCHRLEVLTNLFGPVECIKGLVSNGVFKRNVEDTACALLRFRSGCCGTVTVTHAAFEPHDTLDIFGTKGSIHIPVLNNGKMTVRVGQRSRTEFHEPAHNVHQPLIEDFREAVLSDRAPAADGNTGRQISLLMEMIYDRQG